MSENDSVILFDGVCVLCSYWARFLVRFDKARRYKLATVQSEEGRAILAWCGLPLEEFDTLVLVDEGTFYVRSSAILRVFRGLPFPWPLAAIAQICPRRIRDWLYDRMARNRYRIFGKYDTCVLPSSDHADRFLGPTER